LFVFHGSGVALFHKVAFRQLLGVGRSFSGAGFEPTEDSADMRANPLARLPFPRGTRFLNQELDINRDIDWRATNHPCPPPSRRTRAAVNMASDLPMPVRDRSHWIAT
jgi:hypothetical protein